MKHYEKLAREFWKLHSGDRPLDRSYIAFFESGYQAAIAELRVAPEGLPYQEYKSDSEVPLDAEWEGSDWADWLERERE